MAERNQGCTHGIQIGQRCERCEHDDDHAADQADLAIIRAELEDEHDPYYEPPTYDRH